MGTVKGGETMAEQRRSADDVVARREGAADRRLGRAALRAADAERRADGDPERIEDGARTPSPERLQDGETPAERDRREAANVRRGMDPARIDEGALTPMPVADPDEAAKALEDRRKLEAENREAGRSPTRIEAGAMTPMPPLPGGMTTDHPDAAMGRPGGDR